MLKNFDNVKSIIEKDETKASELDASKKSPLHAAAQNGTREIAGMILNRLHLQYSIQLSKNISTILIIYILSLSNNFRAANRYWRVPNGQ